MSSIIERDWEDDESQNGGIGSDVDENYSDGDVAPPLNTMLNYFQEKMSAEDRFQRCLIIGGYQLNNIVILF